MADWVHDLWFRVHLWGYRLRHPYRWLGPRCTATPPWRLADAGTCIIPRGHERLARDDADWHADGTGYIWNADRWAWRGPVIDLSDLGVTADQTDPLGDHPHGVFTEDPPA